MFLRGKFYQDELKREDWIYSSFVLSISKHSVSAYFVSMLFRKAQDKTAVLESCGGCHELVLAVQGPLEWSGMGVWRWEGAPQKGELVSKDISERMNPTLNIEGICNKFSQ